MSEISQKAGADPTRAALPAARQSSFWRRVAGDPRPPLIGLVILAMVMTVAFPAYRLASPRETYILHLSDDAFYYLSVAPRLAAGEGPTADGITRTTGWHPLYGFLLAGLYGLTGPSLDGFVKQAIALDSALYLLSAMFVFLAARIWWGRPAGVIAALLWLCNPYGVLIAQQALESSLYAVCLSLLLWRFASRTARAPGAPAYLRGAAELGIWGGLVVLSRTDAVLLMPLLALILAAMARRSSAAERPQPLSWATTLAGLALFSVLVVAAYGAWLLFVWYYTGELHQGSAAVKMEWRRYLLKDQGALGIIGTSLLMFGEYVLETFVKVPAFKWALTGIPLILLTARVAQRWLAHFLWAVPVVLGLAYSLLLDWTRAWYYLPGLLSVTLLSAGAATAILRMPGQSVAASKGPRAWLSALQRLVLGTAGLITWAVLIESAVVFGHGAFEEFDSDSEKLMALRAADWLERHAEPGTRVGCWHSGILGYYTPSLDVINLDGLNNNDILRVLRGQQTLNTYWDELGITVLVGRPREKMGSYIRQWGDKQLVPWREAAGADWLAHSRDLDDAIFGQLFLRVVRDSPSSAPSVRE